MGGGRNSPRYDGRLRTYVQESAGASHNRVFAVRKALILGLICFPFLTFCQTTLSPSAPPLEEEGEVFLYVQPFPQDATRLSFTVESLSAVKSDGTEYAFSVRLAEIRGKEMGRQRLLGIAHLPAGTYTGLGMKVKEAKVLVETGEAGLLVPDMPIRIDFPFSIIRKKGYAICMALGASWSVKDPVGFSPVFSLFVPPRPLTRLTGFVTNSGSNSITVFDKRARRATGLITTEGSPTGMALDQAVGRVYVAMPDVDTLAVIDVAAGEITDTIRLNGGDEPRELAVTPDGKALITANTGSNTVSFFNLPSLVESGRISVGNGPSSVLMDPWGKRAYVFNRLSSSISVIDVANKALVTTIAMDPGPLQGQFNRRGDRFYVIHDLSSYLSVIDAGSMSVVKRMSVGMGATSIKVDTATDLVYLAKASEIGVYEPVSFVPVDYIQMGGGVGHITIDGDENTLITVGPAMQGVIMANLISRKTLSVIDVGEVPCWVAVMGER
jgi:YVTN family beta-propeller protein